MPDPASKRGNVITEASFEAPFSTPIYPLGNGGLNLTKAIDAVPVGQFTRLTNCRFLPGEPRRLSSRFGQLEIANAAGEHHSVVRFDDPEVGQQTRLWGVGSNLYRGFSGGLALVDTGYSGDPLTFLPYRPPLSGDPWVFVGDSARMRKTRFDGLTLPIGLPAPVSPAALALGTLRQTLVPQFTNNGWTGNSGFIISDDGQISTTPTPVPAAPVGGVFTAPQVASNLFAAIAGSLSLVPAYYVYWGIPAALNLTTVGGVPALDEDLMHMLMGLSHPWRIKEIRIYFVVSSTFSPSVLPGTTSLDINRDFYVKVFRPGDFSVLLAGSTTQVDSSEISRVVEIRQRALDLLSTEKGFARVRTQAIIRRTTAFLQKFDPVRAESFQGSTSAEDLIEYAAPGTPLRRGDWKRYGGTAGRDWGTVTGLILYVQTLPSGVFSITVTEPTTVSITDVYLTGGSGPDSSEPGTQSYDARYTHYDPRTGAEGNPSPVMATTNFLDPLRRSMDATPAAFGDAEIRQRFYVRGGTITNDWKFAGTNASDGGVFSIVDSDLTLLASDNLEIDHYQPVATVDDAGNTVLAQPVPVVFGPYNGQIFALGDPHRPGHVYACIPDEPDHWPPDLAHEVCSPSEELMNGFLYGNQPYVFSRERLHVLYPNVTGNAGLSSAPTECRRGLVGRWGFAIGMGSVWFCGKDGFYRTLGGAPEDVSGDLKPLWQNQAVNGYAPIDLSDNAERALRVTVFQNEVWFGYLDTNGDAQVLVLSIATLQWRHYSFANQLSALYAEDSGGDNLVLGGRSSNRSYLHEGTDDAGVAITAHCRTAAWDLGRPREEKLLGDQILDFDGQGVDVFLTNYLNSETVVNPSIVVTGQVGRTRAIFDGFGIGNNGPQRARNIAVDLTWSTIGPPPELYFLGTSITMQPDLTVNRVTNWDDLGHPDEAYVMGIDLDCDTGGETRHIVIERDFDGQTLVVEGPDGQPFLEVTHDGRHKKRYSWPAVQANQVRIQPNDDCIAWLLYRADWIWYPEPPRIARWDSHFESDWDQYATGLDLHCDTRGEPKRVEVWVDEIRLVNPATGDPWWDVIADGRQVVHLTLPTVTQPLRGHVFRFVAIDDNPGLLYKHRWHLVSEPSEQHNWNQPFSIWGTQADKYLKALVFEIDTFGVDKLVQVQSDEHTLRTTLTVNTTGRRVVQLAFPQILGRVFRVIPSDNNPSRLYTLRPVFDEEPFQLTRWETQETNHGRADFQSVIEAQVTLKSTQEVTLTVFTHTNQLGAVQTDQYVIPSTGGVKQTRYVPFFARKGILFKYIFESPDAFWLYQEESHMIVEPFVGGEPFIARPWGNDDADATRNMVNSTLAATQSGGGT